MRKLHGHLQAAREAAVEATLPKPLPAAAMRPHAVSLDDDLDEAAKVEKIIHSSYHSS